MKNEEMMTYVKMRFQEEVLVKWNTIMSLRISPLMKFCEYGNELSGTMKLIDYRLHLGDHKLLMETWIHLRLFHHITWN